MRAWSTFLVVFVLSGIAVPAQAQPQAQAIYDEFAGTRSAAMGGAHTAVATSNDTLYINPAGLILTKRYNLDVQYSYAPADQLSRFNFSIVDSKSGPVAGAAAFTHDWQTGPKTTADINRIYVGSAYALGDFLAFGTTARYVRGDYYDTTGTDHPVSDFGGDLGVVARLGDVLGAGVAYQNVYHTGNSPFLRSKLRTGLALGLDALVLAGDAVWDVGPKPREAITWHAGAEYFLAQAVPIRAGYIHAPFMEESGVGGIENIITVGLGWIDPQGGFEATYQQSLTRKSNRTFYVGMQLFL